MIVIMKVKRSFDGICGWALGHGYPIAREAVADQEAVNRHERPTRSPRPPSSDFYLYECPTSRDPLHTFSSSWEVLIDRSVNTLLSWEKN